MSRLRELSVKRPWAEISKNDKFEVILGILGELKRAGRYWRFSRKIRGKRVECKVLDGLCKGLFDTLSHCTCNLRINPSICLQQGAVSCVKECAAQIVCSKGTNQNGGKG